VATEEVLTLNALEDAASLGMASRQIAIKSGQKKKVVETHLRALAERGEITKVGRNLWALSKKSDISLQFGFKPPNAYLKEFEREFGVKLVRYDGRITFAENGDKRIHGWSPYVQGFSSSFVSQFLQRFKLTPKELVADQYVGSGTVAICAKMKGINSVGLDLNPLMVFMAKTKLMWDIDIEELHARGIDLLSRCRYAEPSKDIPFLLETEKQFDPPILKNLLKMKTELSKLPEGKFTRMLWFAFGSILVDSSRLWRAQTLGYHPGKHLPPNAPFLRFAQKLNQMVEDLYYVQNLPVKWGEAEILTKDAGTFEFDRNSLSASITSPPYSNGMDYVNNYKVEAAWLGIMPSYEEMNRLRDKMVVCDNVTRQLIRDFEKDIPKVEDEWLKDIVVTIGANLERKGVARRRDMHLVVKKYFEDIYPSLIQVHHGLKQGAPHIMVLGDSLIAGVYVPTDMILARMAKKVGFRLKAFELARRRRSGQRRDFVLRETILVMAKES
jgi:hypothetical protein